MTLLDMYAMHVGRTSPATTAGLAFLFAAVALYLLYLWLLPKPIPGIPYNPEATKSLLGDAPAMEREIGVTGEFSVWMARQVEKMRSPVCQVFVRPFSKPWILIADFHEAQDILMRRPEFGKSQFLVDGLQCLGDWNARIKTNAYFKSRRQLKQDLMTPTFLNNVMGPAMHDEGRKLIRLFEKKMELANGRPFAVGWDFYNTALDVMTFFAFGENLTDSAMDPQLEVISKMSPSDVPPDSMDEPVEFPQAPISKFLVSTQEATNVLERTTMSWNPKLMHWWWKQQAWYRTIFSQRDEVVPPQIQKAIDNYKSGIVNSALEHMLMREKAQAEKQNRKPRWEGQMMIFADMIAGHHTTGGSMGWASKYLAGYPHVQTKLRNAMYAAIPEAAAERRLPTFEELKRARIPYLDAVMEETFRVNPFAMARETTHDADVLGFKIPKGCQVFMVNGGPGYLSPSLPVDDRLRSRTSQAAKARPHWDESKDMRVFEPERWLVTRPDGTVEFEPSAGPQLGFGMGIRQCWGRRLAMLEIRTVMALLVWYFELLEVPEKLGGYAGYDGISRQPQKVYVRLRKVQS